MVVLVVVPERKERMSKERHDADDDADDDSDDREDATTTERN